MDAQHAGDQFRFPLIDFQDFDNIGKLGWGSVQIPLDRLLGAQTGAPELLGISSDSP